MLDVCPLNFSDLQNLAELATQDFINLDLINSLLVAINRELDESGARTKLSLDSLKKS